MTSFAKASFDVAGYLACRPTYPPRLWDIIFAYHALNKGKLSRALDIGCGPGVSDLASHLASWAWLHALTHKQAEADDKGFVALALASRVKSVRAIDPAQKMVDIGLQPDDPNARRIDYAVGTAEDLKAAKVGGVDLVVAGQAAHWFDYPKVWRQLSKCVRARGTVAFIGYAEMVFPQHPQLNHLIAQHSRSPEALGNYWQPGRRIVEAHLDPVPFPVIPDTNPDIPSRLPALSTDALRPVARTVTEPILENPDGDDFNFSEWDPRTAVRLHADVREDGKEEPWLMRKTFTRDQLEGYFRTWSALHSYHEANPEDLANKGRGKEGDIVDRVMAQIWDGVEGADAGAKEVEVGWPLVLMMIQKKVAKDMRPRKGGKAEVQGGDRLDSPPSSDSQSA